MDIAVLKKALDKNPKSLLFARLSDELRLATSLEQKNEALDTINKGLEINPDFLLGRLIRGRILFERSDFVEARKDFEAVAERDPFCPLAQKLLLETLVVLEEKPKTDIYAKILGTIEPKIKVETNAQEIRKSVSATSDLIQSENAKKAELESISDALDSILDEEDSNNEAEILNLLLQTFDKIFDKILPKKAPVEPKAETLPADSAPAVAAASVAAVATVAAAAPAASEAPAEKAAPNVDDLVAEQLAPKAENLPDLTSQLDSLLEEETPTDTPPAAASDVPAASEAPAEKAAPNIDDLVAEQLAPKAENLPDLTSDMDSLLAKEEQPPEEKAAPNIDDLVAEQLAPKAENLPDLTNDMDSLLAKGLPPEEKAAPSIDDLVAEQLAPKAENLPDLTGDMDSLLAAGLPPEEEPKPAEQVVEKAAPNIDDLIKEQLSDKSENLPDLTSDMDSLLAAGLPPEEEPKPEEPAVVEKAAPNIDDLIKEQLSDKSENLPDLTSDMDSLLAAGLPPEEEPKPAEPAVVEKAAPNIDDLIKEQLSDKSENLPDLTNDMDSLLAKGLPPEEENNEILAQNPTPTLAELYISQGLPQKAVAVYKELLARDPDNQELQAKLAIAEAQV